MFGNSRKQLAMIAELLAIAAVSWGPWNKFTSAAVTQHTLTGSRNAPSIEIRHASIPAGTRITLKANNASARKVVSLILKQAGLKYIIWPKNLFSTPRVTRVTMNLKRVLFWQAIRDLASQADISLTNPYLTGNALEVTKGSSEFSPTVPTSIHGAFITTIMGVSYRRIVSFNHPVPQVHQRLYITLSLMVEPTMSILRVIHKRPHMIKAVDNRAHSLIFAHAIHDDFYTYYNSYWLQWNYPPLELVLKPSPQMGNCITELKGDIDTLVATRYVTLEYPVTAKRPSAFALMGWC